MKIYLSANLLQKYCSQGKCQNDMSESHDVNGRLLTPVPKRTGPGQSSHNDHVISISHICCSNLSHKQAPLSDSYEKLLSIVTLNFCHYMQLVNLSLTVMGYAMNLECCLLLSQDKLVETTNFVVYNVDNNYIGQINK